MKLKLNKKKLKNLSKDKNALPAEMTPQIGGAKANYEAPDFSESCGCMTSYAC